MHTAKYIPEGHPTQVGVEKLLGDWLLTCMPSGHFQHFQSYPSGTVFVGSPPSTRYSQRSGPELIVAGLPAAFIKAVPDFPLTSRSEQPQVACTSSLDCAHQSTLPELVHSYVIKSEVVGASPVAVASVRVPPSSHFITYHHIARPCLQHRPSQLLARGCRPPHTASIASRPLRHQTPNSKNCTSDSTSYPKKIASA